MPAAYNDPWKAWIDEGYYSCTGYIVAYKHDKIKHWIARMYKTLPRHSPVHLYGSTWHGAFAEN